MHTGLQVRTGHGCYLPAESSTKLPAISQDSALLAHTLSRTVLRNSQANVVPPNAITVCCLDRECTPTLMIVLLLSGLYASGFFESVFHGVIF